MKKVNKLMEMLETRVKDEIGEIQVELSNGKTIKTRVPIIIRVDGRAFHSIVPNLVKKAIDWYEDALRTGNPPPEIVGVSKRE